VEQASRRLLLFLEICIKKGALSGNSLIFSNKTAEDVILQEEFKKILGKNFSSVLTEEKQEGHHSGLIDQDFLGHEINDFSQHFYICGPDKMVEDISKALDNLGAKTDSIVFEE
jgi:ferredoxin-NADP reductase